MAAVTGTTGDDVAACTGAGDDDTGIADFATGATTPGSTVLVPNARKNSAWDTGAGPPVPPVPKPAAEAGGRASPDPNEPTPEAPLPEAPPPDAGNPPDIGKFVDGDG